MHKHPLQPYWTEKAKAATKAKRELGIHLGKAPIGYKNVRINGESAIVIDPEKAEGVRMLFEAVAGGMSIRRAGHLAWEYGLRTKVDKELGPSSLHAVLTNPFYLGIVRFEGESIKGSYAALVTQELFKTIEGRLRAGSGNNPM